MNPHCSRQGNRALTLLEAVVVIAALVVLAAIFLPLLASSHHQSPRISCVNNLKQIGLAYRVWADDHHDKYPMQVPIADGGIEELFDRTNSISASICLNYLAMTNELSTPKILRCTADTHGTSATNFSSTFNNANISFFANPDADQMYPQMVLSGDDNFAIGDVPVNLGILNLSSNTPIAWTAERHYKAGNIGLADGSAQQLTTTGMRQAFQPSGTNSIRLAIP
jgi:competence protein ComGC